MIILAHRMFVVMAIGESILGVCCNGFIWLVNCISFIKSKKMSLSEFVITSLAISRIFFICMILADILIVVYTDLHEMSITMQKISIVWAFANFLSIWLATCLSILYCLKVANFSHHAFLWLKWRVSHVVRWNLLATVFFSVFSTWTFIKEYGDTFTYRQMTATANCTEDIRKKRSAYVFNYTFTFFWMIMPFTVSLISYVLIILSLRRHTQQMQSNGSGSRDPSTEAHMRATKIILSFLFLFIVYLVTFFVIFMCFFLPDTDMAWMSGEIIFTAYPSVHSIILIFVNNKLKQALKWMFQRKK